MKTKVVRIGNSQGIRIPKPVLAQVGFPEEVELEVGEDSIILRPASRPRDGWSSAFRAMAEIGDDALLDASTAPSTSWDDEEWEW